ncbi:MAG: hypothetical protein EZS28_008430 [Streblomastix strix]|uniref:SET domain-containing protein n=1 Tax=Streblomastix strix TaxID=222440 RepID=A0A5J4WN05_9EUKA|nr:MAG: hypothetical protein EZS28_008430 [Streblomastix strix]
MASKGKQKPKQELNEKVIEELVNGVPTKFILSQTPWGWGLKAFYHYKKGDIVCHYQGDIIDKSEYLRRVQKKIEEDNLVFSYIQMSKAKILDPDYHDECIGKYANAACRELGESNNCYYAVSNTYDTVNIRAVTDVKPGDWILCAYGSSFSGRLRKLRRELKLKQSTIKCTDLTNVVNFVDEEIPKEDIPLIPKVKSPVRSKPVVSINLISPPHTPLQPFKMRIGKVRPGADLEIDQQNLDGQLKSPEVPKVIMAEREDR